MTDFSAAQRARTLTIFSIIALLLSACTSGTSSTVASASVVEALSFGSEDEYARPTEPREFIFPEDHGPHEEYRTEWWYYTGNLQGENGDEYGYQLTFFRSALSPEMTERESDLATNQLYMAHFALTDVAAESHQSFERFSRGAGDLAGATIEPNYYVWLEDWTAEQVDEGVMRIYATAAGENGPVTLDLTMRETRSKLYHGDAGLSQKGGDIGNANYYYSLVQMASEGTVVANGAEAAVTGLSWMDHEFGTSALDDDITGWDWFAVQLDDGTAFMFGEFHNAAGENRSVYEGTLAYPEGIENGEQFVLGAGDFELEALETWTSPRTGITYPARWRATFPAHDTVLEIEPMIDDQEMSVSFVYYEGATQITGTRNGEPISGRGYVELTGYSGESENQR